MWHSICLKKDIPRAWFTECLAGGDERNINNKKIMKLNKVLLMAGLVATLALGTGSVFAQGQEGGPGGGPGGQGGPGGMRFDPAQFRQRMLDNYREQLGVKDDSEWKVLESQITKVMEARMEVGFGGGGMGMMRPRRNNDSASASSNNNNQNRRGPFAPSAAAEALQKAIDAKAPSAEIKTKLDAYRADVKAKEDKLTKAQDDLKKLLTPEQEAVAVLGGLLK
jgi:hypothetical protein